MNSSWCVRVNRDELFELQVDGTHGSAVAGLRECKVQPAVDDAEVGLEPGPRRTPSRTATAWIDVPVTEPPDNGFKLQWELFLRHVVLDEPFPWDFVEGARGVQLAELGEQSWRERRWVDVPELTL